MRKHVLNTMVCGLLYTNIATASDLDIYASASTENVSGKTVLTIMLDKSGSMGGSSGSSCGSAPRRRGTTSLDYWFDLNEDGVKQSNETGRVRNLKYALCRDRKIIYTTKMSALKAAMHDLFYKSTELKDSYHIGLGFYPVSDAGAISVPARPLTKRQRKAILDAISNIGDGGGTPFANAYAEAGAYMMGTNPQTNTERREIDVKNYEQLGYVEKIENIKKVDRAYCESKYYLPDRYGKRFPYGYNDKGYCFIKGYEQYERYWIRTYTLNTEYSLYKCQAGGEFINQGLNNFKNCVDTGNKVDTQNSKDSLNLSSIGYENNEDYEVVDGKYYRVKITKDYRIVAVGTDYSGFQSSTDTAKTDFLSRYKMPDYSDGECGGSGNGIYFMTDGVPEGNAVPRKLMNASFKNKNGTALLTMQGDNDYQCTGTNVLRDAGAKKGAYSSWSCIGEYAKLLRNKDNPSGEVIKTAAVGFGTQFANVAKINKKVGVDDDGNDITEQVYDCSSIKKLDRDNNLVDNVDAQNLCRMGEKGYGYGEGGSYFVTTAAEIAQSIKDFASNLVVDNEITTPISTGVFSVPFDAFGSTQKYDSYLPMLDPEIGNTGLWVGNVKKYAIKDGAVVGINDNAVLNVLQNDGTFNTNTKDFWNHTMEDDDQGLSQKGGVLSNILRKVTRSTTGTTTVTSDKDRNLWVNITKADGTEELKNIKVSKTTNKPVGFDTLDADYTDKIKKQFINFLGYKLPVDATADLTEALTVPFDASHRTHGAVMHSKPQLISKEISYINGAVDESSRKSYMLYGSFDGSLRIVDDKNGTEELTFVPKHIAKNQGEYLVANNENKPSQQRYGVDASWDVYADYVTKNSTSGSDITTTLEANNVIAAGGLRMGGSKYYALNLDKADFTTPEIIYSVGSDYGPEGTAVNSSASEIRANPFLRMGQTWGTPTTGYVKTDGKKTMVHFLPGGYDVRYEAGTDLSATKTQGNAVYMVQVGTVKSNLVYETQKDADGNPVTDSDGNPIEVFKEDKGVEITYTDKGKLLWWSGSDAVNDSTGKEQSTRVPAMKASVVSSIMPFDRDYDGLTDHIYYADLNGRVYRADIDNSADTYKVIRVVKILEVANQKDSTADDKSAPRFYESPLVTFTRWQHGDYKGKIVGLVSVVSGNRSKPLLNRSLTKPDRIYTFVDFDVASNEGLFDTSFTLKTQNVRMRNLARLRFAGTGNTSRELKSNGKTVKDLMTEQTDSSGNAIEPKQGWFFDLKHWNGVTSETVTGLKGFNALNALEGVLYFTTFNPEPSTQGSSCTASIKGETERDTLCLPFGECGDVKKYAPQNAGKGMVENVFGYVNTSDSVTGDPKDCEGKNCTGLIKNTNYETCLKNCDQILDQGNLPADFLEPQQWLER